ncbi:hypothetical protein FG93_03481 [Bosea sp. LC85]|nr:hypothetical protein FG93_03481 [Bosea sp. LC85]
MRPGVGAGTRSRRPRAGPVVIVVVVTAAIVVIIVVIAIVDNGHLPGEGDRVAAIRQGRRAVAIIGRFVVCQRRAVRQLDHVLGPQRANDRVVTAVRPEDDAVRRVQRRDVDRIVAARAVDRDGVQVEAGLGKIAEDFDRIAAYGGAWRRCGRPADHDLLDLGQFCDDRRRPCPDASGDHDLGCSGIADSACTGRGGAGIDAECLGASRPGDREGIARGAFGPAIDDIATIARRPGDGIVARPGMDGVVSGATDDRVIAGKAEQELSARPAEEGSVGTVRARNDLGVGRPAERETLDTGDRVGALGRARHHDPAGPIQRDVVVGDRTSIDRDIGRAVAAVERVVARAASQGVVTQSTIEDVVAGSAREHVIGRATVDRVIAVTAIDDIGTSPGIDDVVAGQPVDRVIAAAAIEQVGFGGTVDDLHRRAIGVAADLCRYIGHGELGEAALIDIAHDAPDQLARQGSRDGQAGGYRAKDRVPGDAAICRGLPSVAEGAEAVGVAEARGVRGQYVPGARGRQGPGRQAIEADGLVRELQRLDVEEPVGSVRLTCPSRGRVDHCRGLRDMRDGDAAILIAADQVIGRDVPVGRRIDVVRLVPVENLANDVELVWDDLTGEHQFGQSPSVPMRNRRVRIGDRVGQRIHRREFIALVIPDADPHVQPGVAVDDIIAGLAFDQVTAAATQQDVGGIGGVHDDGFGLAGNGHGRRGEMCDQPLQPADQGKVLREQRARVGVERSAGVDLRRIAVFVEGPHHHFAAGERVVVFPARQALHQIEPVAQDIVLLVLEDRHAHVGNGGFLVPLVGRPVEPSHAVVALDALALDHDVVA